MPLINKPLPYQNFQSTLLMGNTFFASDVFSEKVNQAKIGCNFFFGNGCRVCVYGCVYPPVPCCHQPHCRGKPEPSVLFFNFFFFLLQLYKHIVKEQMSCFFFFLAELRLGVADVSNLQIKVLTSSQMCFSVGFILFVAPVSFISVCGVQSKKRGNILPCDTTERVKSW